MFWLDGDIYLILTYVGNVSLYLLETGQMPKEHNLYIHGFGLPQQQLLEIVSLMENTYQFCK